MDMRENAFVKRLYRIRELNATPGGFVNKDLYKLLKKEESLLAGYEKIKSNRGATTPANDGTSLDGFSQVRLTRLKKALDDESWKPRPARRVNIQKPGKKGVRPLGVQGPEEKVVQATMALILQAIYEPIFSSRSFGFRPEMGAHDALKRINNNYSGMRFAIEGDIKGMYDNINHHILISILEKRISDSRFIQLVWKMLRNGYMIQGQKVDSAIGTPQGSIVSPILANVYLHQLDLYMMDKERSKVKQTRTTTPLHKKLLNKRRRIEKELGTCQTEQERKLLLKEFKRAKWESLKVRVSLNPPERIVYTRYADDFIVGVAGSKGLAIEIQEGIKNFLREKLNLEYNEQKSKVSNLRTGKAFFLGHDIGIETSVRIKRVYKRSVSPYLKRTTGSVVKITAPIKTIVSRLSTKGFCDGKGNPKSKLLWTTQEDKQIIELFNYTIRGLFSYYSGSSKKRLLSRIWYILKFSCAHTLAAKHRCSLRKLFAKHGPDLKVDWGSHGEKSVQLHKPDLKESSIKWQTGKKVPEPYQYIAHRLSKSKISESCCICGAPNSEMHHVRHVRDSFEKKGAKKNFTRRVMGLLSRKQIPVCRECHLAIHQGRYDNFSLRDFDNPDLAKR